jgi:hypothetical protein
MPFYLNLEYKYSKKIRPVKINFTGLLEKEYTKLKKKQLRG